MYVIQKQAAFRNFSNVSLNKPNTMLFPLLFYFQTWLLVFKSLHLHPPFSSTPKPTFSVQSQPPSSVPLLSRFLIISPSNRAALPLTTQLPRKAPQKLFGKAFQHPGPGLVSPSPPSPSSCPEGLSVSPDLRLIPPHGLRLILQLLISPTSWSHLYRTTPH